MEREISTAGRRASLLASPYLLLAACPLFWSGNVIVGRALRDVVSPVALNFWRWVIALIILLPFTLPGLREQRRELHASWKQLLLLAATGIVAFQLLLYLAVTLTTAINATLILALSPVTIALFARIMLRERLLPLQTLGIAMSLSGAMTVIAQGEWGRLLSIRLNPGDLWMLAALGFWATYSILLKRAPQGLSVLPLLTGTVAIGVVLQIPLYLWEVWRGVPTLVTPQLLLGLLYIGIFPSVLAFTFWNRGVTEVGPTVAGMFLNLFPIFGAVLAVLFLGEQVFTYHLVGALLVCGGILLCARAGQ